MRRFNRILQFAILHGGYREFEPYKNNFTVRFSHIYKKWLTFYFCTVEYQAVNMTEQCAELLCEKLNSGEYKI